MQSEYSLWNRDVETIAPTLQDVNTSLVAYSLIGRGFPSGAIDPNTLSAADSRWRHPRFQGENAVVNAGLVARLGAAARRLGATPAQVVLAWVHQRSSALGVPVVPIPGTRHRARVDENSEALDVVLDAGVLDELASLAQSVAGARNSVLQSVHASRAAQA